MHGWEVEVGERECGKGGERRGRQARTDSGEGGDQREGERKECKIGRYSEDRRTEIQE
jgi:hypothetical protein